MAAPTLLLALALLAQGTGDPLKDIKAKEVAVRLEAVAALQQLGDEKAVKALLKALDDEDWEVVERSAAALGALSIGESLKPLAELAVEAPVARLRAAAADALAAIDADAAVELLAKDAGNRKRMATACAALARVAARSTSDEAQRAVEKALRDKEPEVRAAGARALNAVVEEERAALLAAALRDEDPRVAVAAAEAIVDAPLPMLLETVHEAMRLPGLHEVVERRLLRAAAAVVLGCVDDEPRLAAAKTIFERPPTDDAVAVRLARLAGMCMADSDFERATHEFLIGLLAKGGTDARAIAAQQLRGAAGAAAGDPEADAALTAAASADPQPRVRRAALAALVAAHGAGTPAVRTLLVERLAADEHPRVREFAAVALGFPHEEDAAAVVEALTKALEDQDWGVAVCAAVSLGKTRAEEAFPVLTALCAHQDWRLRGAAVAGIAHTYSKAMLEPVVPLLDDPSPAVARTAHEYLQHATRRKLERSAEAFRAWWAENGSSLLLLTPEQARERGKEYASYDPTGARAYQELDVVVLDSRGDHIQLLLERIGVPHRMTAAGKVAQAELHPFAVYVSNCTGEVTAGDIEQLRWFVLTGGYLFGSCWSLHYTIARLYPGVVDAVPDYIDGTLVDRVAAEPAVAESPYLENVFPDGMRPVYSLSGAHLIVVQQPERCEVLVDSPECAARWGNGNLAVWFDAGHGLILDSANHFEEQGIAEATGLKTPEDRMAYAVDHLALDYARLRELAEEKWWKSNFGTAEHVFDESAFRFITNFVRRKRATDR